MDVPAGFEGEWYGDGARKIIYPTGDIAKEAFNWVEHAQFNRKTQSLKLVFSKQILPYLFHLKKFIKYNLEHVKAFENKYSMRVYEWLLKELTQRKTHKLNIEVSIDEFKFMLMLEKHKSYKQYFEFNRKILTPITKDLNTYSNIKLAIGKRGRPADTLIFQVELDKQIDLVTELAKEPAQSPEKPARTPIPAVNTTPDSRLRHGLDTTLQQASMAQIQLTPFEKKFLKDMKDKHNLNGSFSCLTEKQQTTLKNILTKYGVDRS